MLRLSARDNHSKCLNISHCWDNDDDNLKEEQEDDDGDDDNGDGDDVGNIGEAGDETFHHDNDVDGHDGHNDDDDNGKEDRKVEI